MGLVISLCSLGITLELWAISQRIKELKDIIEELMERDEEN